MAKTRRSNCYENLIDYAWDEAMLHTMRLLRSNLRQRRKQHKRVDFRYVDSLLAGQIRSIYREPIRIPLPEASSKR